MRWSKIKNIMILMLVIVNVALLAMVGQRRWHNEQNRRETARRVILLLEKNGISYLPEEVPRDLELQSRRVTVQALGENAAATLVGEIATVEALGPRTVYTGAEGVLSTLATGEMTVEFSAPALTETAVLERLSALGETLRPQNETSDSVSYRRYYDGVPLPEESARLTFLDGVPRTLSLRRLAGEEELLAKETTIDGATALACFLEALNREGYVCSQVTALYGGYAVTGSGTVTLRPTWYVETDTAPWRFAVDGVTGQVTALE